MMDKMGNHMDRSKTSSNRSLFSNRPVFRACSNHRGIGTRTHASTTPRRADSCRIATTSGSIRPSPSPSARFAAPHS